MNAFIRLLYALLIAAAVVAFVGLTIFSFYQPPKGPDYSAIYSSSDTSQAVLDREQKTYDTAYKAFRAKEKTYQRNVTILLLPVALVIVAVGLLLFTRREVIGEGLALGGVATTIYAIITASIADARILRFLAVTLLLASTLVIAQRRFHPDAAKK